MSAQNGDAITKRLTTIRLICQRTGDNGYDDFGVVLEQKEERGIARVDVMKTTGGILMQECSLIRESKNQYVFTMQEELDPLRRLLWLATKNSDINQGGATYTTITQGTIAAGRAYPLCATTNGVRKYNVSALTVAGGTGGAMTENTHYFVDYANGIVTLANGLTGFSGNLIVTFTAAALTMESFNAMAEILPITGKVEILDNDQFSVTPRIVTRANAQWWISDWDKHDMSNVRKAKLNVLMTSKPTVEIRAD